MPKDLNSTGRWLMKRLTQGLAPELQDRKDLLAVLREAGERGLVDADALTMLEGVLEVADLQVRDIMVPRAQMVFVRRDEPAARILPVVVESGHSRFPVMDEDRDDIVGILLAKDLLRLTTASARERFDIREYMRPAVFVPESKRLNVLLKEFRRNRNHMAIVVDEYGGVSGLCTIEDVIEQIVGEIDDEFDVEDDQNIRRDAERHFTVRGVTRISEFNEYFGARLSEAEGVDTVAALMWLWQGAGPREAARLGFLFSAATFAAGTYWLYVSIHVNGGAPVWLAVVLMVGLVGIMGLYQAALGYAVARWLPERGALRTLAALPAAWLLVEWWRGWFLTGFSWLSLGYSQTDTWLGAFAPLVGVYGISALLLLGAGALLELATGGPRARIPAALLLLAPWAAGAALHGYSWTRPAGSPVTVAVVQGAIPQDEKWLESNRDTTLKLYESLTEQALGTQLIVWPDSAPPCATRTRTAARCCGYCRAPTPW